jgi:hypothetical protein
VDQESWMSNKDSCAVGGEYDVTLGLCFELRTMFLFRSIRRSPTKPAPQPLGG